MSTRHDAAHVLRRGGPAGGHGLTSQGADLVLVELLGQVGREDVDLGLLLGGQVLATGGLVGVDRLAALLDLPAEDLEGLLVGERRALVLGGVLGSRDDHAQRVAPQRVAVAHGGLHVGLELLGQAHGDLRWAGWRARSVGWGGMVRAGRRAPP